MKKRYSPGPWSKKNGYVLSKDKYPIASITYVSRVDAANAKLIIAAPDLLEALIYIRDELTKHAVFNERPDLALLVNHTIENAIK